MNAPTHTLPGRTAQHPAARPGRRVVDAPMRLFHWLFALCFAGAWLTAESEHWRALHITLGYTFGGLLLFRLAYGIVGPRPVRWPAWRARLSGLPAWARAARQAPWQALGRPGQNLAMTMAMAAVLALAAPLVASGMGGHFEWGGEWLGEAWEELHEALANTMLAAVFTHLGLVLVLSLLRRRNLAQAMLSGRQEGPGPDLVPGNRRWLALVLALAVLGFWVWQALQWPQGLLPTG